MRSDFGRDPKDRVVSLRKGQQIPNGQRPEVWWDSEGKHFKVLEPVSEGPFAEIAKGMGLASLKTGSCHPERPTEQNWKQALSGQENTELLFKSLEPSEELCLYKLIREVRQCTPCSCLKEGRLSGGGTGHARRVWPFPEMEGHSCPHCENTCECDWKTRFKELIEDGADVNGVSKAGEMPLLAAAKEGKVKVVKFLIEQKASPLTCDKYRWGPLHEAARRGRFEICKVLAEAVRQQNPEESRRFVNMRCSWGSTAFLEAAMGGFEDVIALLLEHEADVNRKLEDGTTALMMAAKKGDKETCQVLIKAGAFMCEQKCQYKCEIDQHVGIQNQQHKTALSYAREGDSMNYIRIVKMLKVLSK